MALKNPIKFIRPGRGGKIALGYEATILPEICNIILEARSQNKLTGRQLIIAEQCEILTRGLATVGIIALIKENYIMITNSEKIVYPEDFIDKIVCGNCADLMKSIPNSVIDLVVTSPPYDNLRDYTGYLFPFEEIAKELYIIMNKYT